MALADFVATTRDILEGQGLGESPPLRPCAAAASVSVTGDQVSFALATGEGDKVSPGDVLSHPSPTDATKAYCFYVLSVATDTLTCYNGYKGAPAIANSSTDLNSSVLYQNPTHLEHKVHDRINTIFARMLYPQVFYLDTYQITSPNLGSCEDELPADLEDIKSVYQIVGDDRYGIPYSFDKPVDTAISSTGVIGYFDYVDGSTAYVTYLRKLAIADDANEDIHELVCTGAAALLAGASVSETDVERAKKDSQNRQPESAAQVLWRNFITLKRQMSDELSRDTVTHFFVERG